MEYLLFICYLVLFSWLVTKTTFFSKTGLSKPQLVIIFLLKVIAGIFYGWMGHFYGGFAQMIDTWNFHHNSLLEYQILLDDPGEYFTNLFHDPYAKEGVESFFGSKDSYWNDLKSNVFIKVLSVFDIFSFGHYYVNVIFYAFISLFGPMAIYRIMIDVFPSQKIIVLLATFFVPSFFYWTSGIHKEGLIFLGIALLIYHIYFGTKERRFGLKRWLGIALGLLILLLLRNFVLVLIVPAIIAWLLANHWPKRGLACFAAVYLFCSIAFFTLRFADSRFDFPQAVVSKQQAFIKAVGNSSIPIEELKPTVVSFVKNIPQAITLSAVRPYPSDVHHLLSLAATIETELILLVFLLFLLFRKRNVTKSKNTLYFCAFFSISLLLAIGFSVNNLGAIVRYRSIIIPLVVTIMAAQTDWKAITDFWVLKNKKKSATAI
ncbi:MAG: hypothetical protein ACXWV1_07185 [Chitinophagaceae bacterium]